MAIEAVVKQRDGSCAELAALRVENERLKREWMDMKLKLLDERDSTLVAQEIKKFLGTSQGSEFDLWAILIRQRDEARAELARLSRVNEGLKDLLLKSKETLIASSWKGSVTKADREWLISKIDAALSPPLTTPEERSVENG